MTRRFYCGWPVYLLGCKEVITDLLFHTLRSHSCHETGGLYHTSHVNTQSWTILCFPFTLLACLRTLERNRSNIKNKRLKALLDDVRVSLAHHSRLVQDGKPNRRAADRKHWAAAAACSLAYRGVQMTELFCWRCPPAFFRLLYRPKHLLTAARNWYDDPTGNYWLNEKWVWFLHVSFC